MTQSVVVTRHIPDAGLRLLRDAGAAVHVLQQDPEAAVPRQALLDGTARADVLLTLLTERIDREVLQLNPRLRGIANLAVGYNHVDVAAATALGLPVTNTPGVLTEATADMTWALLLAVARRVPEAHDYMKAGRYRIWGPELMLGADVGTGADGVRRTLGIIGFGRIGQAVARRARGFDMRVLAYDPIASNVENFDGAEFADIETIITQSDFISLHALLTDDLRHIIDEHALRRMKDTAYLINLARGEMVDERALVHALQEGWIAGAALDVFEFEPAVAAGLAECPNAVIVPHIGSATHSARERMATMAATNAIALLRLEQAPNTVNPEVYQTDAYRERIASLGA